MISASDLRKQMHGATMYDKKITTLLQQIEDWVMREARKLGTVHGSTKIPISEIDGEGPRMRQDLAHRMATLGYGVQISPSAYHNIFNMTLSW